MSNQQNQRANFKNIITASLVTELNALVTFQSSISTHVAAYRCFEEWFEAYTSLSFFTFLTYNTSTHHSITFSAVSHDPVAIIFLGYMRDVWSLPEGTVDNVVVMSVMYEVDRSARAMADEMERVDKREGEVREELWEREHEGYAEPNDEYIDPNAGWVDPNQEEEAKEEEDQEEEETVPLYRMWTNGRDLYTGRQARVAYSKAV